VVRQQGRFVRKIVDHLSAVEVLLDLSPQPGGVGDRLTARLREAIVHGRIAAGSRMPSSRALAGDLRVSRGLVVAAYEQLIAEGRLVSRRGSGTTVAPRSGSSSAASPVRVTEPAAVVAPLRPGVPDLSAFPRTAWRRSYERGLAAATDAQLDYPDPAGLPGLRRELADYLCRVRAAQVSADDIVVTAGAAQALALIAAALRSRGHTHVAIEDPASAAIRDHLTILGLRMTPVPVDDGGLVVDALARTRARIVLVTPAHQFPTGVVLAPRRRGQLVDWARRVGGLILEDDYDAEFRYDREPVGCVQGLAPDAVALIGSASKALAPGIRRGWLTVPPQWIDEVVRAKYAADLGEPVLEQLAFADFLACGGYDRHLRQARRAQRTRRDATVAALARFLPEASVSGVAAGLHLVARLPAGVDDVAVAARARSVGLAPLALSALYAGGGPSGLVLGYAAHTPDELTTAIRQLATIIHTESHR
jgi:GntR family transcriptional regulator/MocR family aminotransferase